MTINRLFLRLGVVAVLLAACAPVETRTTSPESPSATAIKVDVTATPVVASTATQFSTGDLASATPAPTVQSIATSRGPNLEATDPQTVSLASGGLQLVEFFEFW